MARQDLVRALVPSDRLDDVVAGVRERFDLGPDAIEVEDAAPGTYRDEQPDRELRGLVRIGTTRTVVGIVVGAAIGIAIALAVPALREWAPFSVIVFAFGGAWATAAVVAARTVQVHRDTGDEPEKLQPVDAPDAAGMRVVTFVALHDRTEIADHLADRGIVLLDSSHPRVNDE